MARELRHDPALHDLAAPTAVAAIASGGVMSFFARDVVRPGNGIVQRVGVTMPLALTGRLAWRLLQERPPRD